ncbi:MAG: hypothetical protein JWM35_1906 [Verrucomicrobia bacterium]|nr:hypothetical protein [Verrucomicrobiota bacterium]
MNRSPRSSAEPPRGDASRPPLKPLERVTLVHLGILLLFSAWAFGGGAAWARTGIAAWGSLAPLITTAAVLSRDSRGQRAQRTLLWLWPLLLFNAMVVASCFNPSFTAKVFAAESLLAYTGPAHAGWPSTVNAHATFERLWLFDAVYLSGFNLLLTIRRRRAIRMLLLVACGNAVLLAIFGTFQRLTSDGLIFGLVKSPNPRFFATFIYGNHWAAYIGLLFTVTIGLVFHYTGRASSGAPLTFGLAALLLMAITPTLAGSRAGTAMILLVGLIAVIHALLRIRRRRNSHGESARLPVGGLLVVLAIAIGGTVYLGRDSLNERWSDTQGQLRTGIFRERLRLYSDTWWIAAQHPAFGWGLGSFEKTLQLIRPRPLEERRQYEHSYVDAHSDWLQSLAEAGFVGTLLLVLCGAVPLRRSHPTPAAGNIPMYLLGGCALILLYAAVEFPFGNPAVTVAFWLCFFSALQYTRLQSHARHA